MVGTSTTVGEAVGVGVGVSVGVGIGVGVSVGEAGSEPESVGDAVFVSSVGSVDWPGSSESEGDDGSVLTPVVEPGAFVPPPPIAPAVPADVGRVVRSGTWGPQAVRANPMSRTSAHGQRFP